MEHIYHIDDDVLTSFKDRKAVTFLSQVMSIQSSHSCL